MAPDHAKYMSPQEIADRLRVKVETVVGWIKSGELVAICVARRGSLKPRYRVSPDAFATFELSRTVVPRPAPVRQPQVNPDIKRFV